MQHGSFRNATIDPYRLCFFVDPLFESLPVANQTLVRDVDDGIGVQLRADRRHKKRTPAATKNVDDADHFSRACTSDLADRAESSGPANLAIVCAAFTQRLEQYFRNLAAAIIRQLIERFVGVFRERVSHRADRFVVFEPDWFAVAPVRLPVVPRAHQRMLENRQLIGIVADVVQQTIDQRLAYLSARDADRSGNCEATLIACHSRY